MIATELLKIHDETCKRCKMIMEKKNSDYTGGTNATDALANFKDSAPLGVHPAIGLMIRMRDKMQRVKSFVADGELRVKGETVIDACEDMLNYSILLKAILVEEMENDPMTTQMEGDQ